MLPLQTPFAPCPDKPFDEEQKKNKDRDKRSDRQTGEGDRKRHEKHSLNVEDQKDYGIEIILRVELNLRVADRFNTAFVRRSLVWTGLWRLEKSPPHPGQCQWGQWKHQRHANENDDEEIRMRIHSYHVERSETSLDSDLLRETTINQRFFASLRMTMSNLVEKIQIRSE